ncbi:MAG: D-glycero-alpha-D-manno-heptose-7-phosphate kinase [Thermoleophilaceae bacterium]|nr:D-glycero-alpha-D-manno-heptose-7-phosphate kinase [Thermoleophilaceae bacterium]
MIAVRAPLRITLAGGGTDLPSYYRDHGGLVVSAAIDRHIHILAGTSFREGLTLKHLEWEQCNSPAEVRHPILRAVLERHWDGRPLELASVSDVPAGTGLGSSGAYTVCALRALEVIQGGEPAAPGALAEKASEIEIGVLGRRVGKQDQYASAHGGTSSYTFHSDDSVTVERLELSAATREEMTSDLMLFYTGGVRSASEMLSGEVDRSLAGESSIEDNLHQTRELARETRVLLEAGRVHDWADLLNEQWRLKCLRSPGSSSERIEQLREAALNAGATGAVLMGAGGSGFLLIHSPSPDAVRAAMAALEAPELRFGLEENGAARADK